MIEFKNVNLSFENKIIFKDFNMNINKGDKILLKAASGKGKSTLFKLLLGFERIDDGDILFNKKFLNKNNLSYYRSKISYISQDVDFRNDKVENIIKEIFSYKQNKSVEFSNEQLKSLIKYFKLEEDVMEKEVGQLSGGERQRLGLIVCILLDRDVWLLDEVTAGLDREMKQLVVEYVLEQDKTIIISSHDDIWSMNDIIKLKEW